MKNYVQLASDLHFEAYIDVQRIWDFITPAAPTLVLAGDIDAKKFEAVVSTIAERFENVICVMGNHERYDRDISWSPNKELLPKNVHILDPGSIELDGVVFIGATLWTDFKNEDFMLMQAAKTNINDFNVISDRGRAFTPQQAAKRHFNDVQYIDQMIELNRDKKRVIITHFLPSYDLIQPFWRQNGGLLNYYFSASCDKLIEKSEASAWLFGHTHDAIDMELHGVRCVCNPLGYIGERNKFVRNKVIEI